MSDHKWYGKILSGKTKLLISHFSHHWVSSSCRPSWHSVSIFMMLHFCSSLQWVAGQYYYHCYNIITCYILLLYCRCVWHE